MCPEVLQTVYNERMETGMNINTVHVITYSPTRTSWQVAKAVAEAVGGKAAADTDLTYVGDGASLTCGAEDLAVLAVPVYGGRIAPVAARRLAGIKGQGTPVVAIVVYGNREYEDALLELQDLAKAAGFVVVGAAAFIGEHSFSSVEMPIAAGRPDAADLEQATAFGEKIRAYVAGLQNAESAILTGIPGNAPYKDGVSSLPFGPQVDSEKCTLCGTCTDQCPVGAISVSETLQIDIPVCTLCCRCVKICPEEALSIGTTPARAKMEWLFANCQARKEPVLFFPAS